MDSIVQSIICSQFESIRRRVQDSEGALASNWAMQVKFSLSPDYDVEDGYRNLSILLVGGVGRYIAVFAKEDWNIESNLYFETAKGASPWVCYGYHDSCWRDSVGTILREFHGRINTIDYLFNGDTGWYKHILLTEEQAAELKAVRTSRYEKGDWTKVTDLEFHFPVPTE